MAFNPFSPFSWVTKESVSKSDISRPSKKRKVNDGEAVGNHITLESIAGEIKGLKESNESIEQLLKILVQQNGIQVDSNKDEKEEPVKEDMDDDDDNKKEEATIEEEGTHEKQNLKPEESEKENFAKENDEERTPDSEEEEDPEASLSYQWVAKFEELCEFKKKHGHVDVTNDRDVNSSLRRWVTRQRYEKREKRMTAATVKVDKLNTIGFDWSPKAKTPTKKTPSKRGRRK